MITGSWPRRNEWTEKNTNAADRRIFKTQKALFMIEKINPPISRLTRIDEDHFISPRRHPSTSLSPMNRKTGPKLMNTGCHLSREMPATIDRSGNLLQKMWWRNSGTNKATHLFHVQSRRKIPMIHLPSAQRENHYPAQTLAQSQRRRR